MSTETAPVQERRPDNGPVASIVGGLVWAAGLTGLATLWLARKYSLPFFYPAVFGLLALGLLALAGWHLVTYLGKAGDKEERLKSQRSVISTFLVGTGIFLIVCGSYFLITYGLSAMGEGVGLIALGLAVVVSSTLLREPGAAPRPGLVDFVQARGRVLGKALLINAAALLCGYYLVFWNGVAGPYLAPELIAAAMLVLLCGGLGIYLAKGPSETSPTEARLVVLILGGGVGLALFVLMLGRAILWSDTIIGGGLAAWQGDDAWRLWLCAYLGMAALGLMTLSLVLSRPDIRGSATLRRVYYGFNTAVTALLLFLVLAILNIVVYALMPYQFDWSADRGAYALANSSKSLLGRLEKKVTVYLTLSKGRDEFPELYAFLDNCKAESDKFTYKAVPPDASSAELNRLAKRFPVIIEAVSRFEGPRPRGGMLVVYGDIPESVKEAAPPHAFIKTGEMYTSNAGDPERRKGAVTEIFRGEEELMKQLSALSAGTKSKVYVLQDDGELNIFMPLDKVRPRGDVFFKDLSTSGGVQLKDFLKKDNFEVFGLSFLPANPKAPRDLVFAKEDETRAKRIPADANFVLVLGPSRPLAKEALAALDAYMEKGGKMLVCLDIFTDPTSKALTATGLEELLKKYGVDATPQYLLTSFIDPFLAQTTPPDDVKSDLHAAFKDRLFYMSGTRTVQKGLPGKFEAAPLLHVDPKTSLPGGQPNEFILETEARALADPLRYLDDLRRARLFDRRVERTPAPVGLAVTPSDAEDRKPRLYVFGDTDFVSDAFLLELRMQGQPPEVGQANLDLVRSCLAFSGDRPTFVGPKPRKMTNFMPPADTNWAAMLWIPGWVMVLIILGLGGGVWLARRR